MYLKDADGMAKKADPELTVPLAQYAQLFGYQY